MGTKNILDMQRLESRKTPVLEEAGIKPANLCVVPDKCTKKRMRRCRIGRRAGLRILKYLKGF